MSARTARSVIKIAHKRGGFAVGGEGLHQAGRKIVI